jgi:hypothetical protein
MNFRILRDAVAKPDSAYRQCTSGQDDGERNFDDCGRSQTIHLPLAWWKAEQFIELSKDKNPFNNPDKKHLDKNYRSYSQVIDFNNAF